MKEEHRDRNKMDNFRMKIIDIIGGDNADDLESNGKFIADKASKFAKSQCLPLGLLFGVIMSISFPFIGYYIDQGGFASLTCIVLIMFISGLNMQTEEWAEAIKSHKAILYSLLSILVFSPLVGCWLTSLVVLNPQEFSLGLSIFFCSPCAINSSVVVSKQVFLIEACASVSSLPAMPGRRE